MDTTNNPLETKQTGYHTFNNNQGSFEVFWTDRIWDSSDEHSEVIPGWYWWACYPGCLPDSEHVGPFGTSTEAYQDAVGN